MTFNIWYGGVSVDFGEIAAAIQAADPDVVGVQEPEGDLQRLADAAGYPYVDESMHLISRYPLFSVERDGRPLRLRRALTGQGRRGRERPPALLSLRPEPGRRPASAPPTCSRSSATPACARSEAYLGAAAQARATEDVPVFMTGDFNSPSHLDWTAGRGRRARPPYPVEWPASKALADAGFRDSYRDAHPDPVETPGFTWTAGQPPPRMRPKETHDRIDWVLPAAPRRRSPATSSARRAARTSASASPAGAPTTARSSRASSAEPAPAPYLVSADPRVVSQGDRLTLRYTLAGGGPGRTVGIVPGGAGTGGQPVQTIPIYDASDHIAPMFGTAPLAPGRYRGRR